jgi:predicted TIM-barrel fold metal-dependent hydrolase
MYHPPTPGLYATDQRLYPLYEVIAAARLPALFHTGQTAVGQGAGAGGGIRLKYGNPIYLDDVAVDFPEMPIIMAHPSFPWQEEALAICLHKAQVFIDLSGWSPKYFPPQLVRYANGLLQDKVLFGSDYPVITPDRWRRDFDALEIKPHVRPKILKDNAVRALGLGGGKEKKA